MEEKIIKHTDTKVDYFEPHMNWGAEDMATAIEKLYGKKPRVKGFHKLANTEDSYTHCPICNTQLTKEAEHHCMKIILPEGLKVDWEKVKAEGKKINDEYITKSGWTATK